jgi:demethylmenaquinone methyltransferase/2-methoxy-6-polyprenyl-1,4-benzoquinol methylase
MNRVLSGRIDRQWRKIALRQLKTKQPKLILDVATGTADFALMAYKILAPTHITGIDISAGMLAGGKRKIQDQGLEGQIELQQGDAETINASVNTFDAVTVAFGVRNFQNLENGLKDMLRVLKPGALGIVLEFSQPRRFPVKQLFGFYFKFVMPTIGKLVSKDSRAYTYLPESVQSFPSGKDFLAVMQSAGYRDCKSISLSGGIASIYLGRK